MSECPFSAFSEDNPSAEASGAPAGFAFLKALSHLDWSSGANLRSRRTFPGQPTFSIVHSAGAPPEDVARTSALLWPKLQPPPKPTCAGLFLLFKAAEGAAPPHRPPPAAQQSTVSRMSSASRRLLPRAVGSEPKGLEVGDGLRSSKARAPNQPARSCNGFAPDPRRNPDRFFLRRQRKTPD